MIEFVLAVLVLFDDTLTALSGVSIFSFFISAFLVLVVLGLYHIISRSAAGRGEK